MSETAKRSAAYRAIDEQFPADPKVIGIGSGSTVVYAVERIKQLSEQGKFDAPHVVFVPTGFQSKQLIMEAGLRLGSIEFYKVGDLDVVFDGADEVDEQLNCIKGGGACLFQEKLVGTSARKFVVVADYRKRSKQLGTTFTQGVPIEVVPLAYAKVKNDLEALGAKSVTLREGGSAKAGPVVTDNCNFILDAVFGSIPPENVHELDVKIKCLVGVVETGFFDYAKIAYFGEEGGTVTTRTKKSS